MCDYMKCDVIVLIGGWLRACVRALWKYLKNPVYYQDHVIIEKTTQTITWYLYFVSNFPAKLAELQLVLAI